MSYQDPNFNKDDYWKRRNKGMRGQGYFRFKKRGVIIATHEARGVNSIVGGKLVSKKAMRKTTKRARAYQGVQEAGR